MSTDAAHWVPPQGRHQVGVGKSMARFLKQRQGIQQTKQNKTMPSSNFYHFKYHFLPESVDATKQGIVELTNNKDNTDVRVERASYQSDEVHVFRGKEESAKEVECVLIYDEESGMFTLEKLDSSLILHHEGRFPPKARAPSVSPLPTPSPAASISKVEDDFSRELESSMVEEDAEGEKEESIPLNVSSRMSTQPSSSRMPELMRPPPVDSTSGKPRPRLRGSAVGVGTAPKTKPTTSSPLVHPMLPASPINPPPSSSTPIPTAKSTGNGKTSGAHAIDVEEEELEFGRPARQTKRPRLFPPPRPVSTALALPGTASANALSLPSSDGLALPGPPISIPDDDDDDDEWDEVAGVGPGIERPASAGADESFTGGDAEEGEEINVDQFTAELDQELLDGLEEEDADGEGEGEGDADGDDIFGDAVDSAVYDESESPFKPMSLNEFAGGSSMGVDEQDDDFSSSSDDSDDD
ncbi:hypothetical protein EW145_g751 [Phellinidium pouzarii]|uniref:Transcription elongation factor Eaf N-terminal domain-containing protein n=1 Tax=Phellinidium pouzarii TaxID=167371 RepID=A0A4S4LIU7_9AGAM|nr:hypothetical protein EW145_g751 [Phellinidium pouzarii]